MGRIIQVFEYERLTTSKDGLDRYLTKSELQKLYETILDRKIDRHNFQKKILSMDILRRLDQHRKIGPHCSPNLYTFDKVKYKKALMEGKGPGF